jgi:type 2 lantibiotic biosynthesis protein LanM
MSEPNPLFLDTAAAIGAKLCRDALWDGPRCNWLGASMEPVGTAWTVVQRAFGPEVYSGTSGIGLFLGRLYQLTGERVYRTAARGAISQASSRLDDIGASLRIAFYSGLTGIAFVLDQLGGIFEDEELSVRGLRMLNDLAASELDNQEIDIISGNAGAIPALLALYQQHRQEFLLDLAQRLGDILLEKANKQEIGWSWPTVGVPAEHDLTGFAHGAGGIAWALVELAHVTGEGRFREAAQAAFRYEQHWFNPQYENWPDFRQTEGIWPGTASGPNYGMAWCHGAPGIGLSRLRAFAILKDGAVRAQAEAALRTTARALQPAGGWVNYSLCHGMSGNAELCLLASQILESPSYRQLAEQVGLQGITQYQQQNLPWPCGIMGGGETPNLMLGLAGIGYFYLRLYNPQAVPSILVVGPGAPGARNES